MKKGSVFVVLFASLFFAYDLRPQGLAAQNGQLGADGEVIKNLPAPEQWTLTDVQTGPIFGNIVCGPNSSIYLRRQSATENPLEVPITELSADGKSKTYDLRSVAGLSGQVSIFAFAVDAKGAFSAVVKAAQDPHSYLVSYQEDPPPQSGRKVVRQFVEMYDAETGMPLATYLNRVRGILACSEDNSFTFLGPGPSKHFELGRASLR